MTIPCITISSIERQGMHEGEVLRTKHPFPGKGGVVGIDRDGQWSTTSCLGKVPVHCIILAHGAQANNGLLMCTMYTEHRH